jgi:hypothetical protein
MNYLDCMVNFIQSAPELYSLNETETVSASAEVSDPLPRSPLANGRPTPLPEQERIMSQNWLSKEANAMPLANFISAEAMVSAASCAVAWFEERD